MNTVKQLTSEEGAAMEESGVWKNWSNKKIVKFQMYQEVLCMDWSAFHGAVEDVFSRLVFTHEFGDWDRLKKEYEGLK